MACCLIKLLTPTRKVTINITITIHEIKLDWVFFKVFLSIHSLCSCIQNTTMRCDTKSYIYPFMLRIRRTYIWRKFPSKYATTISGNVKVSKVPYIICMEIRFYLYMTEVIVESLYVFWVSFRLLKRTIYGFIALIVCTNRFVKKYAFLGNKIEILYKENIP